MIHTKDLDPDVTVRDIFARGAEAVEQRMAEDCFWNKNGTLLPEPDEDDEDAFEDYHSFLSWLEETGCGLYGEPDFGDCYWRGRPFVEDVVVNSRRGVVYVACWGS
jgi:hypothetical protein